MMKPDCRYSVTVTGILDFTGLHGFGSVRPSSRCWLFPASASGFILFSTCAAADSLLKADLEENNV